MDTMLKSPTLLPVLATVSTGLFAGASLYISAVQTPAAWQTGLSFYSTYWAPMYNRAAKQQAFLAASGSACALGCALMADSSKQQTRGLWAVAAAALGSIIPYTLLVIMPVNKALKRLTAARAPAGDSDKPLTEQLLKKWSSLHDVRTVLSVVAFAVAAVALAQR